jgi:hypothetical protein
LGLWLEGGWHFEVARLINAGFREPAFDQRPIHFVRPIIDDRLDVARQYETRQMERFIRPQHARAEHQQQTLP